MNSAVLGTRLGQVALLAVLVIGGGAAQADEFEVLGNIRAERVENPRNAPDSAEQIEETQTTATLSMRGTLENTYGRFISDASYEERHYSEQEEQNGGLFLGSAEAQLGRDTSRFFASLSHSAEELLLDLTLGSTPENLDRRRLTEALTELRLGSSVDRLTFSAFAGQAKFDISTENDSSQTGGLIRYSRGLSALTSTGVELNGYRLNYDNFDDQSFDYRRASVFWRTELRYLSYEFNIGRNSVTQDFRDSSPFFDISVVYDKSINRFTFTFNQFLTDTSQGSDGQSFGSTSGPDGRLGVIDQYKRRDARLSWRSESLCSRCSTSLTGGLQTEDYRNQIQLDSDEYFGSVLAAYQPRPNIGLSAEVRYQDVNFVADDENYTEINTSVGITWQNVLKQGRLRLYAEQQRRKAEQEARGFTQSALGLAFSYPLYRR